MMAQYDVKPEPKDMVFYDAPGILFVVGLVGFDMSCALAAMLPDEKDPVVKWI